MPLYTFYPCLPGGNSLAFEARVLTDDAAVDAFALAVLNDHPSCTHVVVWNGTREVKTRLRAPAPSPSSAALPDAVEAS